MSEFLLIHGTGHGAWCWRDVIPELSALGHTARAIDLPCHGADETPLEEATLPLFAQTILDAISEPVILVGHSMGGFPITEAAYLDPSRIRRLVYLCAYVPKPGMSLIDMRRAWPEQPLADAFEVASDQQSFAFRPALVAEKLYQDCRKVLSFAQDNLCLEPVRPSKTPVSGRPDCPSTYIRCSKDQAIPPTYQTEMAKACDMRHDIETGHSPFFADPRGLAEILHRIATQDDPHDSHRRGPA